jgi:4-aminobutyrate aminotransferase/(S)-3-amino-2-methylpropionate transaminase
MAVTTEESKAGGRAVALRTEIPGPRSRELMERRQRAVPRGPFHATPVVIARARGARVEDVDGNVFLDFAGGIGVMNVGHSQPSVVAAAREQLERFTHTCFSVLMYEPYVALAEKLNNITPGSFPKKTLFFNSGAEAVENAVKVARAATGRPAVICFEDAFHGRTLLTLSLTSKIVPYKKDFGPFAPEIYRVPYAYCYRCSYNLKYPECGIACADALHDVFKRYVEPSKVAAVLVEPVLGEGGFVCPPEGYLRRLHEICRAEGILLIADEVQTGFGRTGRMFACEHFGVEPDLLVTAKSIAAGLPLSALTGRAEIMDKPIAGGLGGTYGGNPVACAAALEAIRLLEEGNLLERARKIGDLTRQRFRSWQERFRLVGDARGLGAMNAIELVKDRTTREPARDETTALSKFCYEHGLITITAGTYGNIVRTLMPLSIGDDELAEGLDILEQGLASVSRN